MDVMKQIEIARALAKFYGIVGAFAVLMNLFVILHILRRGVKFGPKSDLLILSLAVADMIYAIGSAMHGMLVSRIINSPPGTPFRKAVNDYLAATQGMTIICSLMHMIAITGDRLIAMTYPLRHKMWVTRRKIAACIILTWVVSGFATSTQYWWSVHVIDWCTVVGTITGSIVLVFTYTYLIVITVQRTRNIGNISSAAASQNTKTQRRTTLLSAFIVLAFIVCNLPYCVTKLMMQDKQWTIILTFIIYTILNMNTFFDPIIYTVIGAAARFRKPRGGTKTAASRMTVSSGISIRRTPKSSIEGIDNPGLNENEL